MHRASHWPLAVICLGLGALGATLATHTLHAQPPTPVPPPAASVPLPTPQPVPAPPRDPLSFRDVVKKVLPAVVSIEAKVTDRRTNGQRRPLPELPPGIPEEFRRFFESIEEAQPDPSPNLGFGSGVLIDPSGVVLTNYHVVEGADTVDVELHDGRKFTSKDIRRDAKTDLAIIVLPAGKPLPFLELGDSDAAEVGDRVLAVGAPFGLTGSVTHGIISAKSRQNLKLNQYEDFIQTDAAINPGNSGGPLVGLDGKVLGINAAIKTRSGGFQGVGLAVSSNLARDVAGQLLKNGVVRRGYLGILVRELDDELADRLGVARGQGVLVSRVYPGSPAASAGLQPGDVLISLAGTPVKDVNALPRIVVKLPLNQPAELVYVREGKTVTQTVTIVEQPTDFGSKSPLALSAPAPRAVRATVQHVSRAGMSVADLSPELAVQLGYPKGTTGVAVVGIDRGGPAATAGLVRGLVVVKVDRTAITSADEFADAIAAADAERGALLHVLRPTGEVDFVVLRIK